MKVQYKVGPKVICEAEGDSVKQLFERLAQLAAVFSLAEKCGACGSASVVPQVREPQGFTDYELACLVCGAKLTFGQNKEGGGLFAKKDRGWEKWQGETPRSNGAAYRPGHSSDIPF